MKTEIQIRTGDFEYVNQSFDREMSPQEAIAAFDALKEASKLPPENTLPEKEMVDFLYAQIHSLGNHVETYEMMNPAQRNFINQVKKALARKKPEKSFEDRVNEIEPPNPSYQE